MQQPDWDRAEDAVRDMVRVAGHDNGCAGGLGGGENVGCAKNGGMTGSVSAGAGRRSAVSRVTWEMAYLFRGSSSGSRYSRLIGPIAVT